MTNVDEDWLKDYQVKPTTASGQGMYNNYAAISANWPVFFFYSQLSGLLTDSGLLHTSLCCTDTWAYCSLYTIGHNQYGQYPRRGHHQQLSRRLVVSFNTTC